MNKKNCEVVEQITVIGNCDVIWVVVQYLECEKEKLEKHFRR